jgi:hypothetical protein
MAMNAETLGAAIAAIITAADAPTDVKNQIKTIWQDIAAEIINHITANAVVTVATGIAVATTGTAATQTGATTATGSGAIA